MSEEIIVLNNISKRYCKNLRQSLWYGIQDFANEMLVRSKEVNVLRQHEFWALKDISFSLKKGEMLGLLGQNGAGKSTLLKLINGLVKPSTGNIIIKGKVGALIELGTGFNQKLSGYENIFINGSVLGINRSNIKKKLDEIIAFSELEDFIYAPVKTYSSGMLARLGFSVAVNINPDILLVDEILSVGDMAFREKSFNRLIQYKENGGTIILVSHNNSAIEEYCNRALLLDSGKIIDQGIPSQMIYKYISILQNKKLQSETKNISPAEEDVIIHNCYCQDIYGKTRQTFNFQETIVISIEYEIVASLKIPLEFMVTINESVTDQNIASFHSRWSGFDTENIPPKGIIQIKLGVPCFLYGVFNIYVGVQAKLTSVVGKKWYSELKPRAKFMINPESPFQKLPGLKSFEMNRISHISVNHEWHFLNN